MRADSGFWSAKTIRACRRHQIRYSITVRQTKPIRAAIATIQEDAWVDIVYPEGGLAQVAETRYQGDRLIVRRTRLVGAHRSQACSDRHSHTPAVRNPHAVDPG